MCLQQGRVEGIAVQVVGRVLGQACSSHPPIPPAANAFWVVAVLFRRAEAALSAPDEHAADDLVLPTGDTHDIVVLIWGE
ncbi:GL22805 [Drosophila persimilis]|uniref:GL22805 n=1 Tax=Drosophila persimilis TaxID=7234 RepID=B4GZH1_DROPE|nr:GL22805 [Drosophila persimilis]